MVLGGLSTRRSIDPGAPLIRDSLPARELLFILVGPKCARFATPRIGVSSLFFWSTLF